jgi:hypothetical protein
MENLLVFNLLTFTEVGTGELQVNGELLPAYHAGPLF